jgi:hypothetical protein
MGHLPRLDDLGIHAFFWLQTAMYCMDKVLELKKNNRNGRTQTQAFPVMWPR